MSGGVATYSVTFDLTGVSGIDNFTDLSIFKSPFGFWFEGESERRCGEKDTTGAVRSRGYGPIPGDLLQPSGAARSPK